MSKPELEPIKYQTTAITEAEKADKVTLWSFSAPHMRSFHMAWFSFFVAFNSWFSIAPLLPVIKKSLHLTKDHVQLSNLAAVTSTVFTRIIIGPLCDRYGPKITMVGLLLLGSIPVFCVGLVNSWQGLVVIRAFIGILGGSFVMSQAWTTNMFKKRCVGEANAYVGGWGNLGGGSIQVIMVAIFAAVQSWGADTEKAWRLSFLFPGFALLIAAGLTYAFGQDTPRGDIKDLIKQGQVPAKASTAFKAAASNYMSYIMAIQYGASFGVELVLFNMAASYFHDEFGANVTKAGQIALLCGITNIFARALGGWISDVANRYAEMKGRMAVQFALVMFESVFIIWFSHAKSMKEATLLLLAFSVFVQAANGSCFAIVPYIAKSAGGSVSGIVGAGGNCGAICFTMLFLHNKFTSTQQGFRVMGWCVMACAFAIWFIRPDLLTVDPLDDTIRPDEVLKVDRPLDDTVMSEGFETAEALEMGNIEAKVAEA